MERALQEEKDKGQKKLQRLRQELTGTAEEQLAAQQARLKEERIEAMYARASRRMLNQGLIRGWGCWYEGWYGERRRLRIIAASTAKLSKPLVVGSFGVWRREWELEQKRIEAEALRTALSAKEQEAVDAAVALHTAEFQELLEDRERQLGWAQRELHQAVEQHERYLAELHLKKQRALERQQQESCSPVPPPTHELVLDPYVDAALCT